MSLTGFTQPVSQLNDVLAIKASAVARISNESRYIFDELIAFLTANQVVVPKYSNLQRVVSQATVEERRRLAAIIDDNSPKSFTEFLLNLLKVNSETTLAILKRRARDFSLSEMQKEIEACELISPYLDDIQRLIQSLGISKHNVAHYASLVDYYTVTKLRRFHNTTSMLYMICYLQERIIEINENLCDAFIYHCRKFSEKSREYAKESAYHDWRNSESNVTNAGKVLALFIDPEISDDIPFGIIRKKVFAMIRLTEFESVCRHLQNQKKSDDDYIWQFFDEKYNEISFAIRPLFIHLSFFSADMSPGLLAHIANIKQHLQLNNFPIPVDRRIIPSKSLPYIETGETVHQKRYEVMIYLLLWQKIENHRIYVDNTEKYRDIGQDLLSDSQWENRDELIQDSGISRVQAPVNTLLDDLRDQLNRRLAQVGEKIESSDNSDVIMLHREGKRVWRLPYKGKQNLVNNPFFEKLPSTHIADVLRLVHQETLFLSDLQHISRKQTIDLTTAQHLIAACIANGTNYGLYKMSQISDCQYDRLNLIQANHLRLETLSSANDRISNAKVNLPIFKHYSLQENIIHASADGQKFESRLTTFKTRYSSKYFGTDKGVSAITLVANHVPIKAQVIGANEHESHYIFDLLYNNTSNIQPDILSTDTHGTNHVNFALLDLFGYTFAPRYAQFSRVIDSLFTVKENSGAISLSLKKPINYTLINDDWDTIQHIVISLQQKSTTQSTIVRKLSMHKKTHPYLRGITEYDRLIKCLYVLQYIDDKSLRSYVQRALNRGEAYHQLRRAVASVNGNRFRGGADEEIALWNECARLLTNTIIYFNTLILSRLLEHFTEQFDHEMVALIKQVSPVAWINVNLNGTYNFLRGENMINIEEILQPLMKF